ncbi:MAG: class I SAM-dependent methyltransferase [Myxococcales bacterium]|nr:MAG: class I SAM-dependent methyltransferase [Myxococcales bacterium]
MTEQSRILSSTFDWRKKSFLDRWFRQRIFSKLDQLEQGTLVLIDEDGRHVFSGSQKGPNATVHVHSLRTYRDLALAGTIGSAESYMRGLWDTENLSDVIRVFVQNAHMMNAFEAGSAGVQHAFQSLLQPLRRNTKKQSKKHIAAHYDLGNDFFELFLDPSMMYSSAIFDDEHSSLETASINKLRVICQSLELSERDHIVEIGTGWGGFAIYAAQNYGCRVTTTTISQEQYTYAKRCIEQHGLGDKITVLLKDYRDLEGKFDKLVSIEMVEALGHQYYTSYFTKCASLLRPGGLALIQAITIADQEYERAKDEVDFIKKYIFPGSCIPSTTALLNAVTRSSRLELVALRDITSSYSKTIAAWKERLLSNYAKAEQLGLSPAFLRMWLFYFAYCEGGFQEHYIAAKQLLFRNATYTTEEDRNKL